MSAKTTWSCNNRCKGTSEDPGLDRWYVGMYQSPGVSIVPTSKEARGLSCVDFCSIDCALGWAKAQLEKEREAANVVSVSAN